MLFDYIYHFKNSKNMVRVAIYQIYFLFLCSLTSTLVIATRKDEGWERVYANNITSVIPLHYYGGKSYYMGTHFRATYHQAIAFCEQIHMTLLSIRSYEENERIYKFIREASVGNEYWTSGTRLVDGFSWLWLPYGERIDYTNWSNGQPSDVNEKCLQLWVVNGKLHWNDRPCDVKFWFICERFDNANVGPSF
ncbi:unnamed protein product [Phaedon cochleariae]|uniref:C-type lectin domain-containing protein n=1 Tax=Phaedon cochleariae TaxID=80249 RepID=A0A9P0DS32_PHACE|nr:unnamed protein product [Phaedon cochleariae]